MRFIIISLLLIGCSPKSKDIYWVNEYGEKVPIVIKDTIVIKSDTIR